MLIAICYFVVYSFFSAPTAVPKVSDEVKEQLSVEEQISQISFYLPSDLTTMFSLDSGNIIKYQILVIGQVSNQQFREGKSYIDTYVFVLW